MSGYYEGEKSNGRSDAPCGYVIGSIEPAKNDTNVGITRERPNDFIPLGIDETVSQKDASNRGWGPQEEYDLLK